MLVERTGRILAENAAFSRLTGDGRPPPEMLAACVCDSPQSVSDYLGRCARNGQFSLGSLVVRTAGGNEVKCRVEGALLTPASAQASAQLLLRFRPQTGSGGFALLTRKADELAREVRQRRRTQSEIRQLNAQLEKRVQERTSQLAAANKELDAFTYTISHDLRSPLRSITGYAEILLEEHARGLSEEARRCLHRMRYNAQRMGTLIDDLLNFSRLGQHALKRETIDPTELVQRAWEDLLLERQSREVTFDVRPMPPMHADAGLIRQVYLNMLSNALKFTRETPAPRIEIGAEQVGPEVVYYVRDNGIGFDMRYAQKLFGVFERLHLDAKYEGTGVGLAIMQRIIHRHAGRIWAEAEVNKGATFHFVIGAPIGPALPDDFFD